MMFMSTKKKGDPHHTPRQRAAYALSLAGEDLDRLFYQASALTGRDRPVLVLIEVKVAYTFTATLWVVEVTEELAFRLQH